MVKYLTIGSYLTSAVCSRCAACSKIFFSLYRLQKNWSNSRASSRCARSVDKPALALAQTQRRGSRACLQAWEGACRRTRALFHVLRGAASPAKTRNRTHENHGVGSAISGVFYIWTPPTLADSGHKKCSCRFHLLKIGALVSVVQIIIDIQKIRLSFALFDGMYHFARASIFPARALPAFFFFIDYLFFFIIIYYTTCHRTAGQI